MTNIDELILEGDELLPPEVTERAERTAAESGTKQHIVIRGEGVDGPTPRADELDVIAHDELSRDEEEGPSLDVITSVDPDGTWNLCQK